MFALGKLRNFELKCANSASMKSRFRHCARSEITPRRRRLISTQKDYVKSKSDVGGNQMNHYTINIYVNAVNDRISAVHHDQAVIPMDFSVDKLTKNIASGSPVMEGFLKDKDMEKDKEVIEEKIKDFWMGVFENSKVEEKVEEEKEFGLKTSFDYDKIKTYGDCLSLSGESVRVDSELKLPQRELKFDPEDQNVLKEPVPFYERGSYESRTVRPKKIISSAGQVRRKLSKEAEETNKQVESLLKLSSQKSVEKEGVFAKFLRYCKRLLYGEGEIKEKEEEVKEIDPEEVAREKFLEQKRIREEEAKRVEEEKKVFQSYLRTFQEKYRENEEKEMQKQSGFFNNLKEKFLNKSNYFNKESKRGFCTEIDSNSPKFFYDPKIRQNPFKNKTTTPNYFKHITKINPIFEMKEKSKIKEREKLKYEELKSLQSKIKFARKNLKIEEEEKRFISKILTQNRNLALKDKDKFAFKPDEMFAINFEAKTEKLIKLKSEDLKRSKEIGRNLELKEIRKNFNKIEEKTGLIERKNTNKQTITFFKRNLTSKNNKDCVTSEKLVKRCSGPKEPIKYAKLKCRENGDNDKVDLKKKPEIISKDISGLYDSSGDKLYEGYFGVGGYRNKEYYSYKKTSYYDLMDAMGSGRVEQPKNPIKPR